MLVQQLDKGLGNGPVLRHGKNIALDRRFLIELINRRIEFPLVGQQFHPKLNRCFQGGHHGRQLVPYSEGITHFSIRALGLQGP